MRTLCLSGIFTWAFYSTSNQTESKLNGLLPHPCCTPSHFPWIGEWHHQFSKARILQLFHLKHSMDYDSFASMSEKCLPFLPWPMPLPQFKSSTFPEGIGPLSPLRAPHLRGNPFQWLRLQSSSVYWNFPGADGNVPYLHPPTPWRYWATWDVASVTDKLTFSF